MAMEIYIPEQSKSVEWLKMINLQFTKIPEDSVNPTLKFSLDEGSTYPSSVDTLEVGQDNYEVEIPQLVNGTIMFAIYFDIDEVPTKQCESELITILSAGICSVIPSTVACGYSLHIHFDNSVKGCKLCLSIDGGSHYTSVVASFEEESVSEYVWLVPYIAQQKSCKLGILLMEDDTIVYQSNEFEIVVIPQSQFVRPLATLDVAIANRSGYHCEDASVCDSEGNLPFYSRAIYCNVEGDYYLKGVDDTAFHKHTLTVGLHSLSIKAIMVMGETVLEPVDVDLIKVW
jgi:hypothetical protein